LESFLSSKVFLPPVPNLFNRFLKGLDFSFPLLFKSSLPSLLLELKVELF
jgi:hypothetical protein